MFIQIRHQGKIKIYTKGKEGKEQIIHIAKAVEIVGFRAMLSGGPYKVSASTMEEYRICFIGKSDFLSLVDSRTFKRTDGKGRVYRKYGSEFCPWSFGLRVDDAR